MRRFLVLFLVGLVGCSGVVSFQTGFQPSNAIVTISGFVSIVQITTFSSANGTTFVTVVTFLQPGTAPTINFCGNIANRFLLDAFTTVDFTQGQNCATALKIITG